MFVIDRLTAFTFLFFSNFGFISFHTVDRLVFSVGRRSFVVGVCNVGTWQAFRVLHVGRAVRCVRKRNDEGRHAGREPERQRGRDDKMLGQVHHPPTPVSYTCRAEWRTSRAAATNLGVAYA